MTHPLAPPVPTDASAVPDPLDTLRRLGWREPTLDPFALGEGEIPAQEIGHLVMEGLKNLDDVGYVRFASVYRDFREARDFEAFVGELAGDQPDPPKDE